MNMKEIYGYIKDAATQVKLTSIEINEIRNDLKADSFANDDMENLYQDLEISDERYVNVTVHPELDEDGRVVLTTLVNVYHEDGATSDDYDLQDQLQDWADKHAEKQYFE